MKQKIILLSILGFLILSAMPVSSSYYVDFKIEYGYWNVENTHLGVHVIINVVGTTPGVKYMEIRLYTRYDNGTEEWTPWLIGPFDYGHSTNNTTTINFLYFSPTAEDWLAWEYLLDEVVPYEESFFHIESMGVEVRAFLYNGEVLRTYSQMSREKPVKEKDPRVENPTCREIEISISEARIIYNKKGDQIDVNIEISGKGDNVSHIALNFLITYKNATRVISGWMDGPFNFGSGSKIGLNYSAYYFISKSGRWESWEFKLNGTIDKRYAPSVYWYDEMISLKVYARAYLDNTELLWNQDSKEVSLINEKSRSTPLDLKQYYAAIPIFLILFTTAAYIILKRKRS